MSIISKSKERLYVEQRDLEQLETDPPLQYGSPSNFNYMAAYAVPVINYLNEQQPDIAIGCDRGGRLFSRAVYSMWYELMDGEPFPTIDNSIHFARISHDQSKNTKNKEKMRHRVREIVSLSTTSAERAGISVPRGELLRILFIDDQIKRGYTRTLIDDLLTGVGAQADFAVMYNSKYKPVDAEVHGNNGVLKKIGTYGLDDPTVLGLEYVDVDQPVFKPTEASIDNIRRLSLAVKRVAGIVKTEIN